MVWLVFKNDKTKNGFQNIQLYIVVKMAAILNPFKVSLPINEHDQDATPKTYEQSII